MEVIKTDEFNVKAYGATGNEKILDTKSIQKAIDACHESGGGAVEFPAGTYRVGNILLRDHVTLHLQRGCTIKASDNLDDYQINTAYLILGHRIRDAGITGEGTISCSQNSFFAKRETAKVNNADMADRTRYESMVAFFGLDVVNSWGVEPWRPRTTLYLFKCEDILIEGVTFIEGAVTTINMTGCRNVRLHGIHVNNDMRYPLTDVINIVACQNVFITDSYIASSDDPICIYHSLPCLDHVFTQKDGIVIWCINNGFPYYKEVTEEERKHLLATSDQLTDEEFAQLPTENVIVSNCILQTHCNAFRINGGKPGVVRNINISNCIILSSSITFNIKMFYKWPWGSYSGTTRMENILISNITATAINRFPVLIRNEGPAGEESGHIRNVSIQNSLFEFSGGRGHGIYFGGHKERPLENIRLNNVEMIVSDDSSYRFQREDIRYPNPAAYEMSPEEKKQYQNYDTPPHVFYCRNVDQFHLHNVRVKIEKGAEKYSSVLYCESVKGIKVEFLDAPALENKPTIRFDGVKDAVIQGCAKSTDTNFLHQKGHENENIQSLNNILPAPEKEFDD